MNDVNSHSLLKRVSLRILFSFIGLSFALMSHSIQKLPEFATHSPQELFDQAHYYLDKRNNPDSAFMFLVALTSLEETNTKCPPASSIYPIAYNTLGALHASVYGNYSEAAVNFLKGLEVAQRNGDKIWEKRIRYNLTAMDYEQRSLRGDLVDTDSTLNLFVANLNSLDIRDDIDLMLPILLSIAEIGIREDHSQRTNRIFNNIPGNTQLPTPIKELALAIKEVDTDSVPSAIKRLDTQIEQFSQSQSVMEQQCAVSFRIIRTHLLLKAGKEEDAISAYSDIIRECEAHNDLFPVFEIYRHLHQHFALKGDSARSVEYQLKAYVAKDRLINRSGALSLEGPKALYNEKKLQKEISSQIYRNRVYRIVFWLSISFLIVLLALLWMLYRKYRQLRDTRNIIVRNDRDYFHTAPILQADSGTDDGTQIGDTESPDLFQRILKAIKDSEEIYDEEFNTKRLAEMVGEKTSAVSAAIMSASGESTTQFLARIRIREACRRINDNVNYGDYTIEAIGQSVGYRSRSHFGAIFKKIIGMPPSEYAAKVRCKA